MPGILSTSAGVRKAGIALKPAHRRSGCWFCPGTGWVPLAGTESPPSRLELCLEGLGRGRKPW